VRRPGAVLLAVTAAVAAQALPLSFAAAPGGAAAFRPGSAFGLLRPGPAPLVAQEDGGEEALRDLVASIARSWSRGDADGVLSTASEDGVRLQLLGGGSGRQSRRRAAAVLRRLLAENEGGRAGAGMVSVVGGSPPARLRRAPVAERRARHPRRRAHRGLPGFPVGGWPLAAERDQAAVKGR
jgi:hypothetical protein